MKRLLLLIPVSVLGIAFWEGGMLGIIMCLVYILIGIAAAESILIQ